VTVLAGCKEEVKVAAGTCQYFMFEPPIHFNAGCFVTLDQAGSSAMVHIA
jgi:hypothetical protein